MWFFPSLQQQRELSMIGRILINEVKELNAMLEAIYKWNN